MIRTNAICILILSTVCSLQGAASDTGGLILKVSDEECEPVPINNVQVWIQKTGGSQGFTFAAEPTDVPGVYKVLNLPARKYKGLKVDKPNYAPGWVKNIEVTAGEMTELECVLLKGGSVAGSVMNENGVPLPNIPVVVNSVLCRRDVATDESGNFKAEHLYPCNYSVSAEPGKGTEYKLTFYDGGAQCGDEDVIITLKNKVVISKQPTHNSQSHNSTTEQEAFETLMGKSANESQKTAFRSMLGKPAPPLIIEQWYNSTFWDLKLNHKVVVLHFWGIWCSACKTQMPGLCQLAEKYKHDKFEMIGIHTDHFKHGLPEYLSKTHLPYLIAVDNNEQTREIYHVTGYPTTVVIDRKGIVRTINPKSLEDDIKQLLSE
jgi:thiol-disulfide isomerase/thioredoxin